MPTRTCILEFILRLVGGGLLGVEIGLTVESCVAAWTRERERTPRLQYMGHSLQSIQGPQFAERFLK